MNRDRFIATMQDALEAITEPRLFKSERGYQGELLAMLRARLADIGLPGDPIIEQEYQKRLSAHGINIRPDLIVHVPFDRGTAEDRRDGNFVAVEIKLRSADVREAFDSLRKIVEALDYALTVFINVDSEQTHADMCPASIAQRTVCYAVQLKDGLPVVRFERCG